MIEIEFFTPHNLGLFLCRLPDSVKQELWDKITPIQQDFSSPNNTSYNHNLAGHIKHQYVLNNLPTSKSFLEWLGTEYNRKIGLDRPVTLNDCWANFQTKHEFNPYHNHSGALSFVIWLQIPYELAEETKLFPDTADNKTSKFEFTYTTMLGQILTHAFDIDKSWEGKMCLFPSAMPHTVYPFFTSDGVRISVSGNLI